MVSDRCKPQTGEVAFAEEVMILVRTHGIAARRLLDACSEGRVFWLCSTICGALESIVKAGHREMLASEGIVGMMWM